MLFNSTNLNLFINGFFFVFKRHDPNGQRQRNCRCYSWYQEWGRWQFIHANCKMINSTWGDQAKHKDLVKDGNISLGASNPSSKLELNCEDEETDQQCDRHHGGPHCSWYHPYWTKTGCFPYSYTTLLEVQKRNHPIISKNVNINKKATLFA